MGQILSRIFNFIFGSSSRNGNTDPDLEKGLPSPTNDHPPETSSSAPCKRSSTSSSSSTDRAGVPEVISTPLLTFQPNTLVNESNRLISDEKHDENLVATSSLELDENHEVVEIVVEKEVASVTLIDHAKEVEKTEEVRPEGWINCYSSCQKILLVGEGDFSFSSSLATAFGSATNMIATSLDSREFLQRNYGNAIFNIKKLQMRGCMVIHEVDATEMANHPLLEDLKFDRIIYNFPLAGFFKNQSRQTQLMTHRALVMGFMENAKRKTRREGEIHITHKCNGFFLEWDLTALASSTGLRLLEELPFRRANYPGYCTKYGFGGDKNFNCYPSKTYKFGLQNPRPD